MIHSKFLIHWTGKKFKDDDSALFLERLKMILSNGFLMEFGSEQIYGSNNTWIKSKNPRVCFTEVKLSQAGKHADRYGKLGIGVDREFVLKRYGNPVFYTQNGSNSLIIENCDKLHKYLESNDKVKLKEFEIVLSFIKNMSDKDGADFKYYDELEWRIIHYDILEQEGIVKKIDAQYYCHLDSKDIKIIVFPDQNVKSIALEDDGIRSKIIDKILVTLDDCGHF